MSITNLYSAFVMPFGSMNNQKTISRRKLSAISPFVSALFVLGSLSSYQANAQVGDIIWEDNFNTFNEDVWTPDHGNGCSQGLCGFGNQEKQSYEPENVSIQPVPGEPGNFALALQAKREFIAEENRFFSSGKIDSNQKLSVQYGMIEVRVRVPDLDAGYWPAVWMLGTSTLPWPRKGEIDMMEMGNRLQDRQEWLGRNSNPNDDNDAAPGINSFTGSNMFFFSENACNEFNLSCAANVAFENDNAYASSTPMSDRFVIYRTYWTPDSIRFTVEDNGVENAMFQQPFGIESEDTLVFREPFYLLMNLAVGGTFPGILSDDPNLITAPDNGIMYVDYIRVHELDGHGTVTQGTGTTPETGTFGVFTDNTPTTNKLEAGVTSNVFLWDPNSSQGSLAPYEGDNVITFSFDSQNVWFGGGVQANQARDMSNFADGNLKFKIRIPAEVPFRIGITDTFGNENWVTFPAFEENYGLVRNGEWSEVTIPVADLRGTLIALQSLQYMFAISSVPDDFPQAPFQYAVDNIVYEGGGGPAPESIPEPTPTPTPTRVDSDGDGVVDRNDDCPNTVSGQAVDSNGCPVISAQTVRIQAQDYVGFSDSDVGNRGRSFRDDDVDIQATEDVSGEYNVGWTEVGEWLEYSVELGEGTYDLLSRVASDRGNGSFTVSLNGDVVGADTVSRTGGWQNYETHELEQVTITQQGTYVVRIDFTGRHVNLNWLELRLVSQQAIDSDADGVNDVADQCPNTARNTNVDSSGCPLVEAEQFSGAVQLSSQSAEFFVNTGTWADVHYTRNGGGQLNHRMSQAAGRNSFVVDNLESGDQLVYFFTYLNADTNLAVDTQSMTLVIQ